MNQCPHCRQPLPAAKSEHSKEDFAKCKRTWLETLSFFGQGRSFLLPAEEQAIFRAIQENTADAVNLALVGARYEPRTPTWNPHDHVDIVRVLTRDSTGKSRIQKFLGYGIQASHRDKARTSNCANVSFTRMQIEAKAEEIPEHNPEKVREIIAGLFKRRE